MSDERPSRPSHPAHWGAQAKEVTGVWAEKRRLAESMRVVIERLVTMDAPEEELAAAADALERYADHLATHRHRRRLEGFTEASTAGDVSAFFDFSPLIGRSNPLAPPLDLSSDGKRVLGRATFGSAYEGPPGHVHGGYIAAAFDEVLGYAQSLTENPGMTGRLVTHYRRPTPLHTELRFEAELVRVEGRKIFTEGRLYAGETLTAEAEGLFIAVDREKMRAMAADLGLVAPGED